MLVATLVGEIPADLHHERAIRPRSDSGNVHFSRGEFDDDEHIVGHEPAHCGDLDGEEVGRRNGLPMGGEKRAPWRPLTSLRRGLDAMFSQNIGDGAKHRTGRPTSERGSRTHGGCRMI